MPAPAYLLALDQGTSSSRSIVFDGSGAIVAMAQRELPQHFPQPGWVEHDAEDIWTTQLATARQALAKAGLQASALTAIGITNQRETTVLWERASGRPIHRAIVWQDRRTEPLCAELRAQGLAGTIAQRTGLVVDAYFSATKIRWLLDHVPGARAAAERGELAFGTIDSWLMWRLTGGRMHVTDVSNASRTMLYDIRRHCWDTELLKALAIPDSVLPVVLPSSHAYGTTQPELLGAAVPIGGIAGDQQAALFGQACFTPGLAKNTYGTGCFLLMHTGAHCAASTHGLVTTAAAQTRAPVGAAPEYALEGSVFIGGAVVQWLRDGLGAVKESAQIEALAASVPDAGGVSVVPAFTGLGAPWWQPDARGAILGLTRGSTVAHIARAALESIAFQSAALLQAMASDVLADGAAGATGVKGTPGATGTTGLQGATGSGLDEAVSSPISELRVDGGACANDLLMQFQADLLGIPVVRPKVIETTALGAAYLAGLATGVWPDRAALSAQWQVGRRFHPTLDRAAATARMQTWQHAVRQTLA